MTILAEFSAIAVERAAVQSLPQSLHRRPRQQLEVTEGRSLLGRDEMGACHDRMVSRRRETSVSASMPSASA